MRVSLHCRPGFSFGFTGASGPVAIAGRCELDGSDWAKARRFDQVKAALESGDIWEGAESVLRVADAGRIEDISTLDAAANDTPEDTDNREG